MYKILFLVPLLAILTACTTSPQIDVTKPMTSSSVTSTPILSSQVAKEVRTIPSPTYGSGRHTLEVFADFQCPACQNFSKTLGLTMEEYASKGMLKITYTQFPLTGMHKNAYRDAMAALCGAEQGKYMETKKALYALETEKKEAKVSDADRVRALTEAGLDGALVSQCLASDAFAAQVDREMARGESMRVTGTPTLFLDGKKLDLSTFKDPASIKTFLDRVLAE